MLNFLDSEAQRLTGELNKVYLYWMEPPKKWEGTMIALDSPNPEHCSPRLIRNYQKWSPT